MSAAVAGPRPGWGDDAVLARLREEFDGTFARPARQSIEQVETLLAIRVGPDALGLRVVDLTLLVADQHWTRLPGSPPELAGVATLRGVAVAGYHLGALLGRPAPRDPAAIGRWAVVTAVDPRVALIVDEVEGNLTAADAGASRGPARPVVPVGPLVARVTGTPVTRPIPPATSHLSPERSGER